MDRPFKILIADDSASVREAIRTFLFQSGNYNLIQVTNGREACTVTYRERPDLVLMDIDMPVMNGIEAIKKIKNNNLIKHIPIIVISTSRKFQEAFIAGATDFLIKPVQEYELLIRVHLNLKLAAKEYEVRRQYEYLKTQKQEAINQFGEVLREKNHLTDDLHYARFIQKAILPPEEVISQMVHDYFIFSQPKSIVSGDFYWVTKKDGKAIIAVADCTGHGMSGALMTMAGAVFLNEIVASHANLHASQILDNLRTKVIQLLNQKGDIGEASNGMDIALCVYDHVNGILEFAGANNPAYLVRPGNTLEVIKEDRMPIGFYFDNEQPFTNHTIQVSKGDMVYLFTDGYPDQIGGPLEKKFRYKQFQELLTTAAALQSMQEQHELIKNTMDDWMYGLEQVDDMLILGIQF